MAFIKKKDILKELVNSDGTRIGSDNVKLNRDNSKSASNSTMDPMYNPEDGDQIKNSVVQSTRQPGYRGWYSLVPMPASGKVPLAQVNINTSNTDYMGDSNDWWENIEELANELSIDMGTVITEDDLYEFDDFHHNPNWDSKKKYLDTFKEWFPNKEKHKISESSKNKMKSMVEDIVDKKFPKEVVDKIKKYGDINKNGIPDIEVISEENPLLVRKVKNLIDIISKNQATGEQKGVILNFLVNNIDTIDIPSEYKKEIIKKIR
jgi:hypothetical protein